MAERIHKLEEAGVITGYHASVSLPEEERSICAFIRVRASPQHYVRMNALARDSVQIRECYHVSGEDAFMLKVVVGAMEDLEALLAQVSSFGQTVTAIVLSTSVDEP